MCRVATVRYDINGTRSTTMIRMVHTMHDEQNRDSHQEVNEKGKVFVLKRVLSFHV